MSQMLKWQKSAEKAKIANAKAKQQRRDNQDLKDAGVYISPDEKYRDEHGYIKGDAPQWFKNLSKAHKSNDEIREINAKLKVQGHAPMKRKRKKKTMELKPRKVKLRRTDVMIELLYTHGVTVLPDEPIVDYEGFTFLTGGKMRTSDGDIISTYQFIKDYV